MHIHNGILYSQLEYSIWEGDSNINFIAVWSLCINKLSITGKEKKAEYNQIKGWSSKGKSNNATRNESLNLSENPTFSRVL